jgi:hypothetical protein
MESIMTQEIHYPGISPEILKKIVTTVLTSNAVDYSPVDGVRCPVCGAHLKGGRMGVRKTKAWHHGCRERYHTCSVCGMRFKSVESEH